MMVQPQGPRRRRQRHHLFLAAVTTALFIGESSAWVPQHKHWSSLTRKRPFISHHHRFETTSPRRRFLASSILHVFPFTAAAPKRALSRSRSTASALSSATARITKILDHVGSGSYGTVHEVELQVVSADSGNDNAADDKTTTMAAIAKRSWTLDELSEKFPSLSAQQLRDKHQRCQAYLQREAQCLRKLQHHMNSGIPTFRGMLTTPPGAATTTESPSPHADTWLVTDLITAATTWNDSNSNDDQTPAPSLADILLLETQARHGHHHSNDTNYHIHHHHHHHHLGQLALALGVTNDDDSSSIRLVVTLDIVLQQLLECLEQVHSQSIVHRDIKPANILVSSEVVVNSKNDSPSTRMSSPRLTLIDFGSAADLEHRHGDDNDRVAVSPVYAAPELFVDVSLPRVAMTFDCFSLALLYCQLLFQYCDDRTDAGFRQQLQSAQWDLDTWLNAQLQSKVAPTGLSQALDVLRERPGLWALLQSMLRPNPRDRMSSRDALDYWNAIQKQQGDRDADGPFLNEVLDSMEYCLVASAVRPLHFVATFARKAPLGLVLAEAGDDEDTDMDTESARLWQHATSDSVPGEVFVKGVAEKSQAAELGIFEIGDRLLGIGELPVGQGGFEKAVAMLQEQPRSLKYVTLHFDRKSAVSTDPAGVPRQSSATQGNVALADAGAWSVTGRRAAQEDAFVISEIHDMKQRSIRVAAIMDGHLGSAASNFVRDHLAETISTELGRNGDASTIELLDKAWTTICDNYRSSCEDETSCTADYDADEGALQAFTGSHDAVAGTTAVMVAFDAQENQLTVLNCGDSRGVVVRKDGSLMFASADHSPGTEVERFEQGQLDGQSYELPECILSKWIVPVGDYNYAVSRSLEGRFATSRGIISEADVRVVTIEPGMTTVLASDGLWEVMDSKQVASIVHQLRHVQRESATDAAKILASLALEKGSSDNVSVIVMYLE